jgi:hypothetical protein
MFGTVRYMVFFVMQVKTREVQVAGIRVAPDGDWMKQTTRNLLDPWTDSCATRATSSTIGTRCSPRRGRRSCKPAA